MKTKIIAEAGINHNGSVEIAKRLIDTAVVAGCDYIKWQKRNPDVCVPEHQKNKSKSTPWGDMTYLEYKHKTEFGKIEYDEIYSYCKGKIECFASVWDEDSVDFMTNYTDTAKIPSALITNLNLCQYTRRSFSKLIISTGMSTEEEIEKCVNCCDPDVIMHTNSTYPCPVEDLNLSYINWLVDKWMHKDIGYSGHEYGLVSTFAAVAMGATWIERHITLDRTMWGSDHLASVEPQGLIKLVKGIRDIEQSIGKSGPREVFAGEIDKGRTLRNA
ncbi:N-acetylneuraminate synthase [bacterium]|nr:N-acetylneuraminate synthase [bacterium]